MCVYVHADTLSLSIHTHIHTYIPGAHHISFEVAQVELSCSRCCDPNNEMVPLACGTMCAPLTLSFVLYEAVVASLNPVISK